MKIRFRSLHFLIISLLWAMLATAPVAQAADLIIVTIDGSINPASADYLIAAIEMAGLFASISTGGAPHGDSSSRP